MKRVIKLVGLLLLAFGACSLLAQSSGDAASAQRETQSPRAKKVYTNDDFPSANAAPSSSADVKISEEQKTGETVNPGDTKKAGDNTAKTDDATKTADDTKKTDDAAKTDDTKKKPGDGTKTAEAKKTDETTKTGDAKSEAAQPPDKRSAEEFLAEREKRNAEWNKRISEEQEKVEALGREVETLSREHQAKLREQAAAAWLNYAAGSSPEDEKAFQQLLQSKQRAVDAERLKLQSLQDEARQAGVKLAE